MQVDEFTYDLEEMEKSIVSPRIKIQPKYLLTDESFESWIHSDENSYPEDCQELLKQQHQLSVFKNKLLKKQESLGEEDGKTEIIPTKDTHPREFTLFESLNKIDFSLETVYKVFKRAIDDKKMKS